MGSRKFPIIGFIVILVVLLGGIIVLSRRLNRPLSQTPSSPVASNSISTTPTPSSAINNTTSNTQLDSDTQNINTSLNALDNDLSNADQGLNDQPTNLQ